MASETPRPNAGLVVQTASATGRKPGTGWASCPYSFSELSRPAIACTGEIGSEASGDTQGASSGVARTTEVKTSSARICFSSVSSGRMPNEMAKVLLSPRNITPV